mgnify:CR=1 FL=1
MPHSSSTSLNAVVSIFSPSSCFPLGRSQSSLRNISRSSPLLFVTKPPPAVIFVRFLQSLLKVSSWSLEEIISCLIFVRLLNINGSSSIFWSLPGKKCTVDGSSMRCFMVC